MPRKLLPVLLFAVGLSVAFFHSSASAQTFSKAECISRLNKEVDRPFRLSLHKATARCNAIQKRVDLLSRQILGQWQTRLEGRTVTLQFFPDGTAKRNFGTGNSQQTWAIVNPYGTVGAESIQFDDGYLSAIKISGSMMTITSQPASHTWTESWRRIK